MVIEMTFGEVKAKLEGTTILEVTEEMGRHGHWVVFRTSEGKIAFFGEGDECAHIEFEERGD